MEVEVREEASQGHRSQPDSTALLVNNTPSYPVSEGPVVVVRAEEVLLVVLVLMIWVAAIALFFNRWGKIRMLEPYQPKFHQQPHRPSCPLAPLSPPAPQVSNSSTLLPMGRNQKLQTDAKNKNMKKIKDRLKARMSFSKYNVNAMTDPLSALPSPIIRRPRQNSVFVGSSTMAVLNPPPRRVKSAMDIQHLIVNDHSPTSLSGNRKGSLIPILNRDRRPSISIERPHFISRHRPSIAIEKPLFSHHQPSATYHRPRRSSCFVERPSNRHRNFISFEHANTTDRKMSISIERPSCSHHQPTISFEPHIKKFDHPFVVVEGPRYSARRESAPSYALPKMSKSFEQPSKERTKPPERMAASLDVSSISFDRRCSIPEEEKEDREEKDNDDDRSSVVSICLDETRITAPLLESLKSSDV